MPPYFSKTINAYIALTAGAVTATYDIDIYSHYKTIYPIVKTIDDVFYHSCSISNHAPCTTNVDLSNKVLPNSLDILTESKLTRTQSKVVAIISVNRSEYIFVEHVCYTCGFIVLGSRIIYDSAKILSIL
ncbi:unnamed protein product [Rotaria sordida]|uniref:Uncharacterized protein n=1 Tax=Rotaria sordida TaxID=392033 RepID=A0A819DSI7_9BILA|nr:unnamed protein product [Rotaria sordida]